MPSFEFHGQVTVKCQVAINAETREEAEAIMREGRLSLHKDDGELWQITDCGKPIVTGVQVKPDVQSKA